MGVFAQVGLLLWKNTKLRIRSPLLTITTLFWPIVIFIIIAVIRTRLPPLPDRECHFKPQALPSVGTTDFLQSMMCDLQTECLSEDKVPRSNEPPVHGASIGLLLDDLDPLLSNQSSLINDLESLPNTLGPLLNLTQTLEDVFDVISEQNFYLGDFFMDQTRMKDQLRLNFEGAELDVIETLLMARINVLEVLDVIGYSDSGSVICNASSLETYVIFPPNTNVEDIAKILCKLSREDTENIVAIILEELDVHYIADEVSSFIRALDRYGLSNFTRDVLDIREQLENITALADFVDVLPDLIQLTRLIPDIQRFLEAIQGGSIDQTLYVLRNIIDTIDWEGSPPWWSNVQKILLDVTDVVSSVYDTVVDVKYGDVVLKDVFRDVIDDVLKRYNISSDSLAGFLNGTIQESKIPDIIVLLMNPEDTIDAYCNGEIYLEDFLTREGAANESLLRNTLCKIGNGTSFLEALLSEFKARRSIPDIMKFLNELFPSIAPDLDLPSLINQTQEIIREFDLLPDFLKDLPPVLTSLNASQLAPLLDLVSLFQNHSTQDVLIQMLVEGTTVVEGLLNQFSFLQNIKEELIIQNIVLDAQIEVVQRLLDGGLVEAFKNQPFTKVGELFLEFGPNITEAILSTFLDPTKIEELMSLNQEEQQLVLCSDFIEYPPGLDVTAAQEELCRLNLTDLFWSHVDGLGLFFPKTLYTIRFIYSYHMYGTYDESMLHEMFGNATFKNIIYKLLEYQELLTSLETEWDVKDFFANLTEHLDVTGTPDEWHAMIKRLTTNFLPALQESILAGEWESVLNHIGDSPEVHSFQTVGAIEDIIIQDINIILSLFNSLSRGEVPAYGGETEKLLHGIVFMTQQGNAIQAAILEAYQDPVRSVVLGETDITQVLCNATLRDSLLDLRSVDIGVLDSSLCNLNYGLLVNETIQLMQIERLYNLVYYIHRGWAYPLDLNLTAVAVHANELVKTIGELDRSWQNWIELVVNGSDWLSLAPQFTPEHWMRTWDTMYHMPSYANWTALFEDLNLRNLTSLIEDLVIALLPGSEVYLHKIARLEVAGIQAMYGADNAFKVLQDLSRGYVSVELRGTQVAGLFEFFLRVDLLQLNKVFLQPEVIGVVSQTGLPSLFCNATVRDVILDLPGKGIDTSYFYRTICSVDFGRVAQELYEYVNGPEIDTWLRLVTSEEPDEYYKPSEIYLDSYTTVIEGFIDNLANIGELAKDLGEQFKIGEILVYYEKHWLTDLMGGISTNQTDWNDLLKQQLTALWENLDEPLADIPGWDQYRTNVYLILSAIEQITTMNATAGVQPFTLASIVPNVTEFISILREIPNLTDDLIYQLIYAPIDPIKLIELASTNSWNETVCNAELLTGIFITPAGLNLTQLQGALCAIDFEALIRQLSKGTGIEHFITMIIDHITSFNGGDDFGIGDYDPTQWASRIDQLIKSFDAQNIQGFLQLLANELMMVYEDIDSQLVNVTGWLEFKADLTILMSVLQYTTPFLTNGTNAGGNAISLSMLVPNTTELEILLAQKTQLSPEAIQTLLNAAIDPTAILELALSHDWNGSLCTEEGLMMFFVWPEDLNLTEIQGVVCSLDFDYTLMELIQEGAIESFIALIIDQFYVSVIPEFALPDVDFKFLNDIIPPIISMIQTGDMQNITELFESLNSLSAMFANETWYQDTIKQLQFMDFITKTFTDKIIMLEGQAINFPNLGNLLANSSELQRILLEDYQVGLGLVEAMMTLSLHTDKLIAFFNMTNPLLTLCATGQFSSFFYSPLNPDFNITRLEEAFCKLDAQQLVMELKDLVSLDDILEQIEVMASNNQTGPYNWTAGYVTDERFSQAISRLVQNPPKLTFEEMWVNRTLDTLHGLADRWTQAQERLVGAGASDIASSFDGLAELLQHGVAANQSWAIEMSSALRTINAVLDYTNDKVWALPGRNITLADLLPPDIASHIEASSDLTPDMIALLLGSYVNTGALISANSTWLDIFCSDPGDRLMMFQVPPDVDLDAAQQALCSVDYEQWALAYMQEIQNILIEVESGKEVNFTSITENFERLATGIQAIIDQPPTLLKYNEEWFNSIIQRTGDILKDTYNDTEILDPNNIGMMLNQLWLETAASNPSLLVPARMNDYITQVLIDLLQRLPGQTYTIPRLDELFGDTTYVRALLSHSNIAPEIIDTFMILAVEQEKIVYLLNTSNVFVELCQSGQFSTFFQLPPDSPTDITVVEAAVCSTNLTLVLAELDQKFKFTEIGTQIERILGNNPTLPPFNKTAASLRMMEFSNLITALVQTPPQVTVDPVWWENVYNRSEVIVLQWLQRLTEQAMNGSSVPGLDMVLAQIKALDIPGFDVDKIETWIQQSQTLQTLITQALSPINGSATNDTKSYIVPILQELFPDTGLVRELFNLTGLPEDIREIFLQTIPQIQKWLPMLSGPDPLRAVCDGGLFQDIFLLTNTSIDIQALEGQICSLNLTDIDAVISQFLTSDFDALVLELLQMFYQAPGLDLQTALNVSREISELISSLISDPAKFEFNPQRIIELLQSLQLPGLNQTWVQDWYNQIQLSQYINDVITNWVIMNNGTGFALPTFNELFPDPTIIVELLTDLGVPTDITAAFLEMAVQADQWTDLWLRPDPLQAVCNSSLFQDIFTQTLNSSVDIQTIQDTLCSLNLSNVDAILNDIFKTNPVIIQLVQMFYQGPALDLQTALNVSREISELISSLITDPAKFELNPQRIIELLQSLQLPGLNQTWVQDWYNQIQLSQYINDVITNWVIMNNGTGFALPTFNELFPDPTIIVELLTDLGVPIDITAAFLEMAIQADQWTDLWLRPDPLQAVCNSSLFQDIFTQTLNSSVDIQTIQDTLCSLNLSNVDAILNDIFKTNPVIIQLVQMFYQGPALDLQTALNVSREISELISSLITDPAKFELNPQRISELLQSLGVPGLNESWVQDWYKQVQFMQYINNVINNWVIMNNGTEFVLPTFNELFPDPTIIVELLTDLGVPTDITAAFLEMAVQADQWTDLWLRPDPLQAVCNSSLFQDIFTQTLNSSVDIQTIQDTLCSLNLSNVDAILNDIFKTNPVIIQISMLLFNDPTMDWETAWNTSLKFSQMFEELFQNPPTTDQDVKQVILFVFNEVESILRMYGEWDGTEHILKYVEIFLQSIRHHLGRSNIFLKDLIDPTVSLDNLVGYVGLSPEEIQTVLLGEIGNLFSLAELYQVAGDWNYRFHCNDTEAFEARYNSSNDGFLDQFAVREAFCSLNISEFLEGAKNLYGFDFLKLTDLRYVQSRNGYYSSSLDIESLVDVASDIAQMIADLASLPHMLTQDLDLDFFTMRLANLTTAIATQDYQQLIVLLDELAALLNSPDIVNQLKASLMTQTDIVSWFESINSEDAVLWLERIEGALNDTLLWHTILPALNFVDLLIEADVAALNPLGFKYYDLITNVTVLQQYLTDILGLAPDYAQAITLSGIKDLFVLVDHHLSGTWESTYCIMVDPAESTHFNITAVYSLLCNLDRDQFFDAASELMGIDVLGLGQWIDGVKNPERVVTQRFDWQTLVSNVESSIDMLKDLSSIGELGGVNLTQVGILIEKLQQGMMQLDYEVLIEQMELLNQILYLNGHWDEVKGHMNSVTNIVEWLNLQLDNAQANNISLGELITHHAMALQNLYYALGQELFAHLVTALVDPKQAMALQSDDEIEEAVCDVNSFNDLLKPTVYQDTTSLQGSLCELLVSGHPTIANDLMTHFNIAPVEHEITVLATKDFQDVDIDMRHMINQFEKLSATLLSNTFNGLMHSGGMNATMLPTMDMNTDDVLVMIYGALVSSLPAIPHWNETIYPILGRLDLAMTMVQDLFFSLPGREAEIQAVLDNTTIVNDATPVILMEVPKIIEAWNEVMQQPVQIPVLSNFVLELLTGSLEGISEDPSFLIDMLVPGNSTNQTTTAMIDLLVSLDRILLTEFAQQLMDVFRIRENAARLSIITNPHPDLEDLEPFDAYFIGRTQAFITNAIGCSKYPSECIIELHAPATLELLLKLSEVATQLPAGSLESLGDVFNIFSPILEDFIKQTGNRTSNLERTLHTAFSFLMTAFEANEVHLIDVLSIFELEGALLNSSSVYQFLKENTDLTELDFMAIKNGSINTTVLFELLDIGTEDSINLLCHEALIDDLFIKVDPNITAEIVKGVCSNGTFIAVDFFRDNLDLRTLIELINNKMEMTFPEFILDTFTAIGKLPDVDYEALGDFVTLVAPALFKNGIPKISDLESLADNINITSRALKSVDALMSAVEDLFKDYPQFGDVQQLVRTLLDNLYIIELIAEFPDLSVRNILENEVVLEDYLAEKTEMTRREARDIIYSTFDLEELFLTELAEYLAMLCDPNYLSTILIFPNQTDVTILANTMCSLSGEDIAAVIDTLIPFVDVGAIMNVSYMADDIGDAFSISNATITQVMRSIASLEAVTMALPSLQEALSNFNDDPAAEKLREIAELGFYSGEEFSAVTQEIVCGSTSLRARRDADENEKIQRYKRSSVSETSNDFCQNIFSSIVEGVDGRLVWAYLKPIVEGRILFSPDIPPVRRIIEKANKTFEDIAMTQRFADVWLTSGGDLGTVLDPDALDATTTLLENSYVQGLLEDQYGISTDQFMDVLNGNLTSIQSGQLQTLNLLAELISNLTRCFNLDRFEGYNNEDNMVKAARNLDEDNTLLAAVAFDIPSDATELPAHIKYKIRMDSDNTPPTDKQQNRFLTRSSSSSFIFDLRYLRGYIMLQDMIEGSIVSLQASPDLQPPGVYLQMTPYPCFLRDDFTDIFTLVLPLVMTISFVVLIGVMTYQLVYEKERGIEELLKVMGLPGGINWWAWFISNSLLLILLLAFVTLILKFGNILPNTDWTLLLVFILDYFFSLIMFCYLASAVFQRASIASLASILVYSLFYLPYLAVFASEALLDTLWKPIVLSIFFPSTFSIGCVLMSQFEGMGVGAHWNLIWHNPAEEEITSMGLILVALAVDGAIYLILGWYIKTLYPGKYGVPRSWYFPLQPTFWCNCSISKKRDMTQYINSAYNPESGVALTDQGPVVEEEPSNHPLGLAILNLTKIYRSCFKQEKVAVDNLSLNFFEGQVTALLGHNGAGKTTTINIITGLFPATSGKVYLHGLNVAKQASVTRENLGVCVQHNALYDNLTVREHMALTGRVKGLTGKDLDNDIYDLLEDVGLLKKSEEQVRNLSGGMKRKLSVAMAFVGHSTIVILDEPTSGVDPHARRAIWNLIMKNKTGRTIVLCTHFMDEADILGDRIAILDRGHLRCCGSPAFLKSRFSSGYRLSLTKEATSGVSTPTNHAKHQGSAVPNIYDTMKSAISDVPSTSSGIATEPGSCCDTSLVTDFIQARISTAQLQDDIGSELVFALPVEHGEREHFQELFEDLDNNLADLHIKSYGISDTTLKEVFLKVSTSRSVDGETAMLRNNNWTLRKPGDTFTIAEEMRSGPSDNRTALLNAWGIFIKRLHFVRRDWQGFIWTILMPVIMVALAVGFSQLSQINREYERQLTPAMFNPNSYAFFSDESDSDMGQRLTNALTNTPGLGTTCMADADQMDLYPCIDSESETVIEQLSRLNLSSLSSVPEDQCQCTATGFGQECTPDAGGIPPPAWLTDTQIILQNITIKEDKDRYILDTQQKFRNSRYGGVSWFDVAGSNETRAKAWYNNRVYHAMPTYLNVMNNIILRATVGNNAEEYGITAYNHPLQLSKQDLGVNIWLDAAKTFGIVLVIVIALVLIPSAFCMFLVTENVNGSKRLHHVSGVGTLTYWLTNLIWDMLSFCIPLGLMLVVLYIFNFRALILASNIGAFVALVFLYGFAVMSQIYIFLSFFKEAGSAFIFFFCILLLESVITNLPNWLMAVNVVPESEIPTFEILNYVLLVFSPYCLSSGLLALIQNQATADIYQAFGMEDGIYEEPFDILKWHMVALAVEGVAAFLILLIVDAVRNSNCSSCLDPNVNEPPSYHDNDDVMEEKQLVLGGGDGLNTNAVILKELRKVYKGPGGQKIVAVNDLCLSVSKGECFGLLGVNGAGKTSTFRMITGDLSPTEGSVKMKAKSVGYCPQENAMYPQLTGEELLCCYARMKGIQSSDMKKAISEICEELGMEHFLRRRISTYSGGMKRCLAVAVALLGKPELILMDEPTTGMDPITKQKVLASVVNVIRDNRSVILTSHSMEECEAVCTRLAIMVNGQFCCLGSPQHVKNRHGNGYSLVVRGQKTEKSDMSLVTEFVHRSFPGAELKEHHHNLVRFQLPPHNITVATIFGILEREKNALNLEDYSVSQTTLDEVFVNFAKKQTDGLEDDTSSTSSGLEVSIVNRAFESDDDLEVQVFPRNSMSAATQF